MAPGELLYFRFPIPPAVGGYIVTPADEVYTFRVWLCVVANCKVIANSLRALEGLVLSVDVSGLAVTGHLVR